MWAAQIKRFHISSNQFHLFGVNGAGRSFYLFWLHGLACGCRETQEPQNGYNGNWSHLNFRADVRKVLNARSSAKSGIHLIWDRRTRIPRDRAADFSPKIGNFSNSSVRRLKCVRKWDTHAMLCCVCSRSSATHLIDCVHSNVIRVFFLFFIFMFFTWASACVCLRFVFGCCW